MISATPTSFATSDRAEKKAAQVGFSLVELMIAITIGLMLLAGLATLFASNSATRAELDKSSRQIENGRYALELLADEIRHAGYYGPLTNAPTLPVSVTSLPDPCSTSLATVRDSIGLPLQGYAGATTAPISCLNAAAGYKANTAVLVIRRANTAVLGFTSGVFNIQVSGCAGDTAPYVIDSTSATLTLHKNTAPGCTPITGANAADITPFDIRIFFVSTCRDLDCSIAGATSVPTLKRIDVTPTGTSITPLVDGIDNLQFEYGIDTSSDGVPDLYTNTAALSATTPTTLSDWQNVMTLRVHVLARNVDQTAGYLDPKTYQLGPVSSTPGDAYKRHAYSELVRINNPAGRRE